MGSGNMLGLLTVIIFFFNAISNADQKINSSDEYMKIFNKNGEIVYMKESLMQKLNEEANTWHWTPWLPTRIKAQDSYVVELDCILDTSAQSFPNSIFSDEQLRRGAFLLYCLFGIYAFTLLAIVCNDYFIPCVEHICEDLKIAPNVGAATFMAAATSCPEFFVNVISTFLTESDMGIGTIIGSALFNALGVAAIGSIAAIVPIHIDRRPVTRDVIIYLFNVGVLIAFVWDSVIYWYEAVVLGCLYVLYFIIMFNSPKIFALFDKIKSFKKKKNHVDIAVEDKFDNDGAKDNHAFDDANENNNNPSSTVIDALSINEKHLPNDEKIEQEVEEPLAISLFRYPKEKSVLRQIWWLYTFPLRLILGITIPSPLTCRKAYPLAFVMCIVWIGVNSYFVSWSMTVIGHTFYIPDSIMGMTFLAFGGCLPEALSIFIMSRRGEGSMGISNALGANSLAILFALGVPWLIRTLALLASGKEPVVQISSSGIDLVVVSLLVAVVTLWVALYLAKFILRKRLGIALIIIYLLFITFAILTEMGIILNRDFLTYC